MKNVWFEIEIILRLQDGLQTQRKLAMNLAKLGWNTFFEDKFGSYKQNGLIPARISQQHKTIYLALCEHGEITAEVAGRVHHGAAGPADYPTVGDWVAISYLPHQR